MLGMRRKNIQFSWPYVGQHLSIENCCNFSPKRGHQICCHYISDEFPPSHYISEFRENAITTYAYQAAAVFQTGLAE